MECTLVREQDLYQPEYEYLPDILKDGYVRHRHFPDSTHQEARTSGGNGSKKVLHRHEAVSNSEDESPAHVYGTFEQQTTVQINQHED